MNRRELIAGAAACMALACPHVALAAAEPSPASVRAAFAATSEDAVLKALFPGARPVQAGQVTLSLPYVTTPEVPVMVRVHSPGPDLRAVALVVRGARHPLAGFTWFPAAAHGFAVRLRVPRSTEIAAYALRDDLLTVRTRILKVTRGGLGTDFF